MNQTLQVFFRDICELEEQYVDEYTRLFSDQHMGAPEMCQLNHDLLKEIGVKSVGHRLRILQHSQIFKTQSPVKSNKISPNQVLPKPVMQMAQDTMYYSQSPSIHITHNDHNNSNHWVNGSQQTCISEYNSNSPQINSQHVANRSLTNYSPILSNNNQNTNIQNATNFIQSPHENTTDLPIIHQQSNRMEEFRDSEMEQQTELIKRDEKINKQNITPENNHPRAIKKAKYQTKSKEINSQTVIRLNRNKLNENTKDQEDSNNPNTNFNTTNNIEGIQQDNNDSFFTENKIDSINNNKRMDNHQNQDNNLSLQQIQQEEEEEEEEDELIFGVYVSPSESEELDHENKLNSPLFDHLNNTNQVNKQLHEEETMFDSQNEIDVIKLENNSISQWELSRKQRIESGEIIYSIIEEDDEDNLPKLENIRQQNDFEGLLSMNTLLRHKLSTIQQQQINFPLFYTEITNSNFYPELKAHIQDAFYSCNIKPRNHQLETLNLLIHDLLKRIHRNTSQDFRFYLMQHCIGSGKKLTIAALVFLFYNVLVS